MSAAFIYVPTLIWSYIIPNIFFQLHFIQSELEKQFEKKLLFVTTFGI